MNEREAMDIIWLLIRASWVRVCVAIAAGLISGGTSAGLIALINDAIAQSSRQPLIAPFAGLVLLALIFSSLSQFLLVDLSQDAVYQLRMKLSQRILSAPLQQLERLGPSQLLAVLTEDIQAISNTIFVIPTLCVDVAVICGCLIYLGWLSGWVFLAVVVFLGLAIAIVQVLITIAYRYIYLARQEVDRLFKQFRGITEGTKELKLHATRRQRFFEEDLKPAAIASRNYTKTAFKSGRFDGRGRSAPVLHPGGSAPVWHISDNSRCRVSLTRLRAHPHLRSAPDRRHYSALAQSGNRQRRHPKGEQNGTVFGRRSRD